MRKLEYEFSVHTKVRLTEEIESHLMQVYRGIECGVIPEDEAPEGFVNALHKLPSDAPDTLILSTIVGEVMSLIIKNEVALNMSPSQGFHLSPIRVEYREPQERVAPADDAVPLLINVSKAVH